MNDTKKETKNKSEKIFVGVSWPYANGNIHIGHLAGQYVVCDIFARYHRLKGNKVLMVSGSDSHGAPVIFAAEEEGVTPEALAEKSHTLITETYKKLGFLYENYTSTRTENHKIVSQNIFLVLNELGFLIKKKTKQYFDTKVKRFLPDRYVRGTCPHCKAENARGDECPECGNMLDPEDLISPYSTLSDTVPILKETEHYYLDLSKVENELKEWLKDKKYWRKWVREFTLGWLREGLKPRCVTRDFTFGVPVPIKGWENKVLYVWIEAVVGYLSAAIEWAQKQGNPAAWEDFWKDPACKHFYFIAGGNVPFHTIIWPAELIGYSKKYDNDKLWDEFKLPGETKRTSLNLPYDVPANNILTYRGKKMSKGDKVGITLETLLDRYHPDVIRYFFARYAPETQDREFIWKDFIDANNNELVANIGNFINRVLSFTHAAFDGKVPPGTLVPKVKKAIDTAFEETGNYIEQAHFVKATETILDFGHFANKYFNDEKAWETVKGDPKKAADTIYNSLQIVTSLRILLKPFLPLASDTISQLLNIKDEYDPNKELKKSGTVSKIIDLWSYSELPSAHPLSNPDILFPKLEYTDDLAKEDNPKPIILPTTENIDPEISDADDKIVIGQISDVKTHAKEKSLRIVQVSIGTSTILSAVCGDQTLNQEDVVPVALPGAKVKTKDGKTRRISASPIHGTPSEAMLCSPYELGVGENMSEILRLPAPFKKHLGVPLSRIRVIRFEKDDQLSELPTTWAVFENVTIKQNVSGKLKAWIKKQEDIIKKRAEDPNWKDDPIHTAYKKLHAKFGQADIPGSPEEIIDFVSQKGTIPNINNFVDLYNTFSAITGISIGAHDIEKISGTPRLAILGKDVPFKHATTNTLDTAKKGEYAYIDDEGILCRLDIKQGNRTPITKETKHILLLFQGNDLLDSAFLEKSMKEFRSLVDSLIQE